MRVIAFADRVKFVLVHHEGAAAYAKATGRIVVCLATSGPGRIRLANGLYDAKLDHAPVLAITGMQETSVLGTGHQQEVHLDRLFEDASVYDQMELNRAQLPALVDIAVRTAYARRGVAHLTVPNDIQVAPAHSDSVTTLRTVGVATIVIIGDHPATAAAQADLPAGHLVAPGDRLADATDADLDALPSSSTRSNAVQRRSAHPAAPNPLPRPL
jgi:pyruvate dehydrogenase (quinone)/pyruvate oxidase